MGNTLTRPLMDNFQNCMFIKKLRKIQYLFKNVKVLKIKGVTKKTERYSFLAINLMILNISG